MKLLIDVDCDFVDIDFLKKAVKAATGADCTVQGTTPYKFIVIDGYAGIVDCKHGERLAEVLKEKHITQVELARRVGCSEAIISRYINQNRTPTAKTLCRYAEALDVSPAWLAFGVGKNEI